MKNKAELEQDIIRITTKINEEFPELTKYITEMPDNFSDTETEVIAYKNLKDYYNSLENLISDYRKTHIAKSEKEDKDSTELPGYPSYPPSEDIFNKGKEVGELNPDDLSKKKTPNERENSPNEKEFEGNRSGDDLDIPGSELDDQQEKIGSEDEENNYYSLGGDAHNDLEEDKG